MRAYATKAVAGFVGIALVACTAGSAAWGLDTHAASQLLSGEEVHKLVDAGQYTDALRALFKILQLNGKAAGPYDRHDMLMLRAECLLQTHDNQGALATLFLAQKESTAAEQPNEVLMAAAFAELIQKSPASFYSPKSAAIKTPIKILDRTTRKTAYDALFADDMAVFQTKAAAADNAQTLPPFLDAAKAAAAMRAAEFAATGSNNQSAAAVKTLVDSSVKLINRVLQDLGTKETRIASAANRQVTQASTVNGVAQLTTRPQGLAPGDPAALQDIIDTCTKIPQAIVELAKAFGTKDDAFRAAITKAEDIKSEAHTTLRADYTGISTPPTRH